MFGLFYLIGFILGYFFCEHLYSRDIQKLREENFSLKLLLIENKIDELANEDDF